MRKKTKKYIDDCFKAILDELDSAGKALSHRIKNLEVTTIRKED